MKTAMKEFIEKHFYINAEGQYEAKYTEDTIWTEYINEALEKEKEQLNVSFISGAIEALSSSTPVRDRIKDGYFENKAEQYFEYTYKTNNNERK